MIKVPSDIMSRFQDSLDPKTIPKRCQAYLKKWLRLYWDFCQKYRHPAAECESLRPFYEKLRQKNRKIFKSAKPRMLFPYILKSSKESPLLPRP